MSCLPDGSAVEDHNLKPKCAMGAGEGPSGESQNLVTRDAGIASEASFEAVAVETKADSGLVEPSGVAQGVVDAKPEGNEGCGNVPGPTAGDLKPFEDTELEVSKAYECKLGADIGTMPVEDALPAAPPAIHSTPKSGGGGEREVRNGNPESTEIGSRRNGRRSKKSILLEENEGEFSGTEEEQSAFLRELESFFKERNMDFKHPRFYGEDVNCLKLWRAVLKLGGYDVVTSGKGWRQVGQCFNPPNSCTTVSWTFRMIYEKTLLELERHKQRAGVLNLPAVSRSEPMDVDNQASGSGKARRDTATLAIQGSHSARHLGSSEVSNPAVKDTGTSLHKRERQVKGLLKRKKPDGLEDAARPGKPGKPARLDDAARLGNPARVVDAARPGQPKFSGFLPDVEVVDVGTPAEWVKITVQQTKDCFEVYALVPGLLREEVRVQSDPTGRLVISGEPQNPDNPWGVRPFKKIVSLPSKINPHLTSAVVTLHGQLFIRAPFNQSNE